MWTPNPHKSTDLNLRILIANVTMLIIRTSIKCKIKEPLILFIIFGVLSAWNFQMWEEKSEELNFLCDFYQHVGIKVLP